MLMAKAVSKKDGRHLPSLATTLLMFVSVQCQLERQRRPASEPHYRGSGRAGPLSWASKFVSNMEMPLPSRDT